jgi:ribosomal protein S18 acetylase RimI-like enzyme
MVPALDDRRHFWRVIDYLQKDAKKHGILKGKSNFGSFWHNISVVTHNPCRVYIALSKQNRVMGYMVADNLQSGWKEDEPEIHIIEVLPQFRRRGVGTAMMRWAMELSSARKTEKMSLEPLSGNEAFFEKLGFVKVESKYSRKFVVKLI